MPDTGVGDEDTDRPDLGFDLDDAALTACGSNTSKAAKLDSMSSAASWGTAASSFASDRPFSTIRAPARPSNPMPWPAPLINAVRPLRSNSETDIPKQPNRMRVTAFDLSNLCLALLRDRLKRCSDRRGITEIVMPERF